MPSSVDASICSNMSDASPDLSPFLRTACVEQAAASERYREIRCNFRELRRRSAGADLAEPSRRDLGAAHLPGEDRLISRKEVADLIIRRQPGPRQDATRLRGGSVPRRTRTRAAAPGRGRRGSVAAVGAGTQPRRTVAAGIWSHRPQEAGVGRETRWRYRRASASPSAVRRMSAVLRWVAARPTAPTRACAAVLTRRSATEHSCISVWACRSCTSVWSVNAFPSNSGIPIEHLLLMNSIAILPVRSLSLRSPDSASSTANTRIRI